MINELFERELQNTSINGVSLADYVKENYMPIRQGYWIKKENPNPKFYADEYVCSICGADVTGTTEEDEYCHGCGAKMSE